MLARFLTIPSGTAGAKQTLRHMRTLVRDEYAEPHVRQLAIRYAGTVPGRDSRQLAMAIRRGLMRDILFLRDPRGTELLHGPRLLSKLIIDGRGPLRVDCDDAAILSAALGLTVGLRARFVAVGFRSPQAPLKHVFTELAGLSPNARWVEMDVTRGSQSLPWHLVSRRVTLGV